MTGQRIEEDLATAWPDKGWVDEFIDLCLEFVVPDPGMPPWVPKRLIYRED